MPAQVDAVSLFYRLALRDLNCMLNRMLNCFEHMQKRLQRGIKSRHCISPQRLQQSLTLLSIALPRQLRTWITAPSASERPLGGGSGGAVLPARLVLLSLLSEAS
jgi:hypothetical protein